jgi:hypothetical protein
MESFPRGGLSVVLQRDRADRLADNRGGAEMQRPSDGRRERRLSPTYRNARSEPSRAESSRAEPSRAEPSRAELSANLGLNSYMEIRPRVGLWQEQLSRFHGALVCSPPAPLALPVLPLLAIMRPAPQPNIADHCFAAPCPRFNVIELEPPPRPAAPATCRDERTLPLIAWRAWRSRCRVDFTARSPRVDLYRAQIRRRLVCRAWLDRVRVRGGRLLCRRIKQPITKGEGAVECATSQSS